MGELSLAAASAGPGRGLQRLSLALVLLTFFLIGLGGLVNSTGSGLSVPDWPTTYGRHLFLYPPSQWRGGILYEHTHRLVAALVGFLAFGSVLWSWLGLRQKPYLWLRTVALVAFLLVVLQGILGGLTVLLRLPTAVSASHAMVAQLFFACTLLMNLGMRPTWYALPEALESARLRRWALRAAIVWGVTVVQLFLGALTRHTYSALAIPDFPLAFGGIFPPAELLNGQVLVHYLHRLVGFLLAVLMLWQGWQLWRYRAPFVWAWAVGGMVLVLVQIVVGGWLVWSFRAVFPTTLHVVMGTAVWGINTVVFFQLWRWRWQSQHVRLASL